MATSAPATPKFITVGRRKTSIARVVISAGTGLIEVNGIQADAYFGRETAGLIIRMPLEAVGATGKVDIRAKCTGGGKAGQAGALSLGVARGLVKLDPENRIALAKAGHMTRDPREVERKKYGRSGARKRFQFSKR